MKVFIAGSLSGTEPKSGRHHVSWFLELDNGDVYMFEAGENCARRSYLDGVDLFRVKDIFISHAHIDHTGGLLNFFGVVRKMRDLTGDTTPRRIAMHLPQPDIAAPVMELLNAFHTVPKATEISSDVLYDGMVFTDDAIRVEVKSNAHIQVADGEKPCSFSFRITAENKCIIFSGDVRSPAELDSWWSDGADLVLMESGHHSPPEVCAKWQKMGAGFGKVVFVHHGREYLNFPQETLRKCRNILGEKVSFADDGMSFAL